MKRAVLVGLLMGLLNGGVAYAASISGQVVDEITNLPINHTDGGGATVTLYQYDATYNYWSYYTYLDADANGQFTIQNLPTGQYYVSTSAPQHYSEYYNNATNWQNKKILNVSATKNLALQTIKLTPVPFSISAIEQDTYQVPTSGGNVNITTAIINNTGTNQNLKLWVISSVWDSKYINHVDSPVTKTPVSITLVPGNNTVTLPVNIPASYLNGSIDLHINLGKAYGNPVSPQGYAYINKGDFTAVAAKAAPTTAKPVTEEIPLRIADDGTVLLKGPRPQ